MYDLSFRQAALKVYSFFGSMRKTARVLNVSIASICRWNKCLRPMKRRKGTKLSDILSSFIANIAITKVSISCREIVEQIKIVFDIEVSRQFVHNVLHKEQITWKRVRKRGRSKTREERLVPFFQACKDLHPANEVISIDESGFDHRVLPVYGYSRKGERSILYYNNLSDRRRYSLLMAVSNSGKCFYRVVSSHVTSKTFGEFLEHLPIPKDTTILLDNASIHKTKLVQSVANKKRLRLQFVPPYSPEYNPIELIFGIVKSYYYKYLNKSDIPATIEEGISKILPSTIVNSFDHVFNKIKIESAKRT